MRVTYGVGLMASSRQDRQVCRTARGKADDPGVAVKQHLEDPLLNRPRMHQSSKTKRQKWAGAMSSHAGLGGLALSIRIFDLNKA
jgi:hypothetical protein